MAETITDELISLEREAWAALATEGAAGPFYEALLADDVLMLLPGGLVIDDPATVVESMAGAPWDDYTLRDERVLPLGEDAALVSYRAAARRGGQDYEALFASTYVREDGTWRLAAHQQTPIGS
jgi:hypothetical protein